MPQPAGPLAELDEPALVKRRLAAALGVDPILLGILALAALWMALGIGWGLPNTESWATDDISPWVPIRVPKTYFLGWHKYPHLHPWLSLVLYAPWLGGWALTGDLDLSCFPRIAEECFARPADQLGTLIGISRLLSLAMGVGTVAALYALALRLHGDRLAARCTAAAAAGSAVLVHYAHLGNLDVPQCFWLALALVCFAGILRGGGRRDHLGFGLAAGAALGTKEGILGAVLGAGLMIAVLHLRRSLRGSDALRPHAWARASLDRRLLLLAAALVGTYALAANPILNWAGFVRHWQEWLPSHPRMAGFHAGFVGWPAFLREVLGGLRDGLGAPLLVLGAVGLATCRGPHRSALALLAPGLAYLAFSVAPAGYAPLRLQLPLVLILTVFAGLCAARLLRASGARRVVGTALVAAALLHGALHSLRGDWLMLHDSRYAAEAWLRANLPREQRLGTLGPTKYLPRLELLGYEVERIPVVEEGPGALASGAADVLVLSSFEDPWLRRRRPGLVERLLAGDFGHRVVYEGQTPDAFAWLGGRPAVGKVNPRILVLARSAAVQGAPSRLAGGPRKPALSAGARRCR